MSSEERFRATFEQVAVGMAHNGLDGRWLRLNRKLCEIVGYSEPELLQMSFQDITYPADLNTDVQQMHKLIARGSPDLLDGKAIHQERSIHRVGESDCFGPS